MYVLILTMMLTGFSTNSSPAAAVYSVPGFTSEQACLTAGNAWLEQQRKAKTKAEKTIRAMCVKQ